MYKVLGRYRGDVLTEPVKVDIDFLGLENQLLIIRPGHTDWDNTTVL